MTETGYSEPKLTERDVPQPRSFLASELNEKRKTRFGRFPTFLDKFHHAQYDGLSMQSFLESFGSFSYHSLKICFGSICFLRIPRLFQRWPLAFMRKLTAPGWLAWSSPSPGAMKAKTPFNLTTQLAPKAVSRAVPTVVPADQNENLSAVAIKLLRVLPRLSCHRCGRSAAPRLASPVPRQRHGHRQQQHRRLRRKA